MSDLFGNKIIYEDMQEIESRFDSWDWLKNKTVLVTGAYGMLASYMVYFLIYLNEIHPDYHIHIILSGRSREKAEIRFGELLNQSDVCFVEFDLCESIALDCKIDYIIHAASLASPQYYKVMPVDVIKPNTLGTYYLLELARKHSCKGFLFFSSGDVYGETAQSKSVVNENDLGCVDSMSLRSCYGESKRLGETLCTAYAQQYGVPTKSVRICHTYGPTLDLKNDQRMFAEFVSNVVNGQDIIMKSDGSAVRSLCYLTDATDAFFRILKDGESGTAYNMCNNAARSSVKELAECLASMDASGKTKVISIKREDSSAYMESPVKICTWFDTTRLENLGWRAKYDIRSGFQRTIRSFLENESING